MLLFHEIGARTVVWVSARHTRAHEKTEEEENLEWWPTKRYFIRVVCGVFYFKHFFFFFLSSSFFPSFSHFFLSFIFSRTFSVFRDYCVYSLLVRHTSSRVGLSSLNLMLQTRDSKRILWFLVCKFTKKKKREKKIVKKSEKFKTRKLN